MFAKSSHILLAMMSLVLPYRALGAEHQVIVGGPSGLQFTPNTVNAAPGDTVVFSFRQKNHTATQSTFENPCQKMPGGFDSGYIPVSADNTNGPFPAAQFTVTDTNPVWVYCAQGNHCRQGMVFAVNPGDRFAAFQAAAMGQTPPASSSAPAATTTVSSSVPAATTSAPASQTTSATTSASAPASTSTSNDHKVIVGGSGLTFNPSHITAQLGDTVTFEFHQKNHTVTQSTFAEPCISLTQTSTSGQVGFDSGYRPVPNGATTFPTFTIQINDTAPIWAYCKQNGHCGQGMVFAINSVENGPNNFAAFQARAMQLNGTSSGGGTNSSSGALSLKDSFGVPALAALAAMTFFF